MEKLLNIKELSGLISIKETTLRAWVYQKRIPCIRVNGLIRFKQSEIEHWLEIGDRVHKPAPRRRPQ